MPGAGQSLEFFVAALPSLHEAGRKLTVHATLTAGAEGPSLERVVEVGESWQPVAIALDDFTDRPVEARFELRASGEGAAYCALAEPALVQRDATAGVPTVVLITSDTHRADHMGWAPAQRVRTPVLDALAGRGLYFEDAAATSNLTRPSSPEGGTASCT